MRTTTGDGGREDGEQVPCLLTNYSFCGFLHLDRFTIESAKFHTCVSILLVDGTTHWTSQQDRKTGDALWSVFVRAHRSESNAAVRHLRSVIVQIASTAAPRIICRRRRRCGRIHFACRIKRCRLNTLLFQIALHLLCIILVHIEVILYFLHRLYHKHMREKCETGLVLPEIRLHV